MALSCGQLVQEPVSIQADARVQEEPVSWFLQREAGELLDLAEAIHERMAVEKEPACCGAGVARLVEKHLERLDQVPPVLAVVIHQRPDRLGDDLADEWTLRHSAEDEQ